jgi:hypothetical protein
MIELSKSSIEIITAISKSFSYPLHEVGMVYLKCRSYDKTVEFFTDALQNNISMVLKMEELNNSSDWEIAFKLAVKDIEFEVFKVEQDMDDMELMPDEYYEMKGSAHGLHKGLKILKEKFKNVIKEEPEEELPF